MGIELESDEFAFSFDTVCYGFGQICDHQPFVEGVVDDGGAVVKSCCTDPDFSRRAPQTEILCGNEELKRIVGRGFAAAQQIKLFA